MDNFCWPVAVYVFVVTQAVLVITLLAAGEREWAEIARITLLANIAFVAFISVVFGLVWLGAAIYMSSCCG